jgi:putative hydrolase of the HAD superfamily
VIFDLDDTLYEEIQFVKSGFSSVSVYMNKNYGIDKEKFYNLLIKILEEHGRGKIFDNALKQMDLYNKDLVKSLVDIYRSHEPDIKLHDDIQEILSDLKKEYKLGLITDGDSKVQRNKVRALNIGKYFDFMVFSDDYGIEKRKPHLLPYKQALKQLSIHGREAIYIGDNPHKDFIGAKELGIITIRILHGAFKNIELEEKFEADYNIDRLEELINIIKKT